MHNIKFHYLLIFTLLFGSLSCTAIHAESNGDKEMKKEPVSAEQQKMQEEMMKEWMEYATPGENHKTLQLMVGEWDYELKFWHTPDSEPQVSKGTTTIKSIMDGRFLKQKASAEMNSQPFEGMGIMGYNNEKQQYESVWIDNMGTGMMTSSGQYDSETNTIKEEGTYTCPRTNGDKSFSAITRFVDDNTFTYEWFTDDMEGNKYRAMEIVHTKKSS